MLYVTDSTHLLLEICISTSVFLCKNTKIVMCGFVNWGIQLVLKQW